MSYNGAALTPQNAGYYEGVTDVYAAVMDTLDTMTDAPTYDSAVCVGKSIEVRVTPNYREAKVYASDTPTRREQKVDTFTVEMNLDQVIPARRRLLLNRPVDEDGVETITGKNVGPWVALMFAATLDDGTREYRQLYKGRFQEPTNTHHTMNDGDSYQHPTLVGIFTQLSGSGRISVACSNEYAAGQNMLLNSKSRTATPQALNIRPTQGPSFSLTEAANAQMDGDTENSYTLAFDYRGVALEGGALPESGSMAAYLQYKSGSVKLGENIAASAITGEWATFTATFTPTAVMAATGRLRNVTIMGLSLAGVTWRLELRNARLVQGSAAGEWKPAPDDMLTEVYM